MRYGIHRTTYQQKKRQSDLLHDTRVRRLQQQRQAENFFQILQARKRADKTADRAETGAYRRTVRGGMQERSGGYVRQYANVGVCAAVSGDYAGQVKSHGLPRI